MSLSPTVFRSSDAGAPALAGTTGALIALLDAVLVNGYGTPPTAKSPLGWTKVWSAGNEAVYRNSAVTGTGRYLYVNDAASGAGGAREAVVRGYRAWDAGAGTGSDPFPTSAQMATGLIWKKSSTSNSAARAWTIIGNETCFYLFMNTDSSVPQVVFAGDVKSFKPGDVDHFLVSGGHIPNVANNDFVSRTLLQGANSGSNDSVQVTGYIAAAANGSLSRATRFLNAGQFAPYNSTGVPYGTTSTYSRPYPGPISGGIDTMPIYLGEGNYLERGMMQGVLAPLHGMAFADGAVHSGAGPNGGDMLVMNYRSIPNQAGETYNGQLLFELGVDW